MPQERVVIQKIVEQRLDEALQQIVSQLGGLEAISPRGSRVLIKPNLVFVPTDRGVTHPELIEAVVRLLCESAPREIVIAEGSADTYTGQAFRFQGLYRVAARYGARLVDLNLEEGVRTPVPAGLGREYIMVPRVVAECDVLVSLPVFKLWGGCPLSLVLKNLIGLYGGRYYGYNKDSDVRGREDPDYGLLGEVGTELGAHKPTGPQAIAAMNAVVRTHLAIIDALEGGDGQGHWLRLDTLIAGCSALATDTVAMALAGFDASEHETFRLCAAQGMGSCHLKDVEVVGDRMEDAAFPLARLREGVRTMPARFCLNLMQYADLWQMHRAFTLFGFLPADDTTPTERAALLERVARVVEKAGYYAGAQGLLRPYAMQLLALIRELGGTSGSMAAVEAEFNRRYDPRGLYYSPAARTLERLGLAYAVESAYHPYWLLPEGGL